MSKSPITCHVLDSSLGKPAAGVLVRLEKSNESKTFSSLAEGKTNSDGRCTDLLSPSATAPLDAGIYKITFDIKEYFQNSGRKCFYPWVEITFELDSPSEHYHIPLLISPYSYTTYRGS